MEPNSPLVTIGTEEAMLRNASAIDGQVNNYFIWNLEMFQIEPGKSILDLGCGPGLYFETIMRYRPDFYLAADYSQIYLDQVKEKFNNRTNCDIALIDLLNQEKLAELYQNNYDYVLLFDVLEHIEDDEQVLRNIHKLLSNTGYGRFCLRVPALQFIYGENDKSIGHFRRYSLKQLKRLLEKCGFNVNKIAYQNIAGIAPWYFIGRVLKRQLSVSADEGKAFDRFVPALKFIEKLLPPPLGLSLYCICTISQSTSPIKEVFDE
jgi:SAM-dependent methyltransferase